MKVKITFTEPLLGTISGNREITEEFIASKHPEGLSHEEVEAVPLEEAIEKSSTIFARDSDGEPMLWDYQIKGFFKEACEAMIYTGTMTKEQLQRIRLTSYLYKKTIDKLIFVYPRRIRLTLPKGERLATCERPLRGQTMKGERIALARSEQAPSGTGFDAEIKVLNIGLLDFVRRWLDYGALFGLGQWRTSGNGRFKWEEIASE